MTKGKTQSGFEFSIEDEALNNYELLEVLQEVADGNEGMIPLMVKILLGKEQTKALKDHLRGSNGIVKATDMVEEIKSIFDAIHELKNS